MSPRRGRVPCLSLMIGLLVTSLPGCNLYTSVPEKPAARAENAEDRNADTGRADPLGESVRSIVYLDQGWSPGDSQRFYFTSQGSQVLPYLWFLHLEQADSTVPFRDHLYFLGERICHAARLSSLSVAA